MSEYDPMKELNEAKYLNDVEIKTRYSLLLNNEENNKNGKEIGTHWKKFIIYPILDNDIKKRYTKLEDESVNELNKANNKIIDRIKQSKIREYLKNIDNTKEYSNEITKIKNRNTEIDPIRELLKVPVMNHKKPKSLNFKTIEFENKRYNDEKLFDKYTNKHLKPFSFVLSKNKKYKIKKYNYEPKFLCICNNKGKCVFPDLNLNDKDNEEEESIDFRNNHNKVKVSLNNLKKKVINKNKPKFKRREIKEIRLSTIFQDSHSTYYNTNRNTYYESKNKLYDGLKKNNYYLYKDNFIKTEYTNEKDNKKIIDSPLQNKMLRQLTELNKY